MYTEVHIANAAWKVVEANETGHTNKRRLMSEFKVIADSLVLKEKPEKRMT